MLFWFQLQVQNNRQLRKQHELEEFTEKCCFSFQLQVQTMPVAQRKQHKLEELQKNVVCLLTSDPEHQVQRKLLEELTEKCCLGFQLQVQNNRWLRKQHELEEFTEKCCFSIQLQVQTIPVAQRKQHKLEELQKNIVYLSLQIQNIRFKENYWTYKEMLFWISTSGLE